MKILNILIVLILARGTQGGMGPIGNPIPDPDPGPGDPMDDDSVVCPSIDADAQPAGVCQLSSDCPSNMKCCSHRGTATLFCKIPEKLGQCPTDQDMGICRSRCKDDFECPGAQKCCPTGPSGAAGAKTRNCLNPIINDGSCGDIGPDRICCQGLDMSRKSGAENYDSCCGRNPYDSTKMLCCLGRLHSRDSAVSTLSDEICCNREKMNINIQTCCNKQVINNKSSKLYECCGREVVLKKEFACCCCIKYRKTGDIGCCHETLYYSDIKGCCGKEIFLKQNFKCSNGEILSSKDCAGESFNPREYMCCGGLKLHKIIEGISNACCGTRNYHTSTHVCCNGVLNGYPLTHGCCNGHLFLKDTDQCCNGKVIDSTEVCSALQPGGGAGGAGGPGTAPDPDNPGKERTDCGAGAGLLQVLLEGVNAKIDILLDKIDGEMGSVNIGKAINIIMNLIFTQHGMNNPMIGGDDGTSTNPSAEICDSMTSYCCGEKQYDIYNQLCCNGVINNRGPGLTHCCGGKPFSPHNKRCCGVEIISMDSHMRCCGDHKYDPKFAICCDGVICMIGDAGSDRWLCCGTTAFDPIQHICVGGQLEDATITMKCNDEDYKPARSSCCDGEVKPRGPCQTECCGTNPFNPFTHECWDGVVMPLDRAVKQETKTCKYENGFIFPDCDGNPYHPRDEICCGEPQQRHVFPKSSYDYCCGTSPYHSSRYICCVSITAPRQHFDSCCGYTPYNSTVKKCYDEARNAVGFIPTVDYVDAEYSFGDSCSTATDD